jgi:AraC-like DNA-binding protein
MDGNTGVNAILSNLIINAWKHHAELSSDFQSRMAEKLLDFIALSLNECLPQQLPESSIQAGHLMQVKQFIDSRLTDPELSLAMISSASGITPRYLHKLFGSEPQTASRFILNRRLEKCEKALRSPKYEGFTITDIGHMWGFKDAAHFGHTFKRKYLVSPGEYRQQYRK